MSHIDDLLAAIDQGKVTEAMAESILAEVFKEGPLADLIFGAQPKPSEEQMARAEIERIFKEAQQAENVERRGYGLRLGDDERMLRAPSGIPPKPVPPVVDFRRGWTR